MIGMYSKQKRRSKSFIQALLNGASEEEVVFGKFLEAQADNTTATEAELDADMMDFIRMRAAEEDAKFLKSKAELEAAVDRF